MESTWGRRRLVRAIIVMTLLLCRVSARGEDPAFQALLVTRGKELTVAYENCLAAFPPNLKEQLRIAQRAWIVFDNKNEAAFATVGKPRGMSAEDLDRAGLPETVARAEMLRTYFTGPNEDVAAFRRDLDRAEQELTLAYKQSLATLNHEEEQKLRETERAWIDYRDKDMRAHVGDPSGRAALWASVRIARRRATQLREFYLQRAASLPAVAAASTPPAPTSTPPPKPRLDAAARAKLVAEFHNAVQPVLTQTAAGGVLAGPTTLDHVEDLPVPLNDAITGLQEKADALRSKLEKDDYREDDQHEDCRGDLEATDALTCLQKTVRAVKAGDTPDARANLSLFHESCPAPETEAQKPVWKYLDALRTLCNDLEAQAKPYLQHARSAADAGQSGEAVKQYQQAYKIYPDPEVAQTIKHLREDSLGL